MNHKRLYTAINEESFQIRSIKVFVLVNFFALLAAKLLWTNCIGFCMEKSLSIKFTVNLIKTTVVQYMLCNRPY